MNIAPIGNLAGPSLTSMGAAGGTEANDAAAQFDMMFYRMLLQTAKWSSGISGGQRAEQAVFGDMVTDFLAQTMARQQQGFGAMLLNGIDQQGKGST
jgi:Rod binding domain-containing protein